MGKWLCLRFVFNFLQIKGCLGKKKKRKEIKEQIKLDEIEALRLQLYEFQDGSNSDHDYEVQLQEEAAVHLTSQHVTEDERDEHDRVDDVHLQIEVEVHPTPEYVTENDNFELAADEENEKTEETEVPEEVVTYRNDDLSKVQYGKSDIALQVNDESFKLHRNVLAHSSPFFERMFASGMKETEMEAIPIEEIESKIFKSLVDYMYSGEIKINNENSQKLWIASDYLEISYVQNATTNFLTEQLKKEIKTEKHDRSFFDILEIAYRSKMMQCTELFEMANKFIGINLKKFMNSDEFLSMNFDHFTEFIKDDDIIVECTKEDTFHACMRWIQHDENERMPKKGEILAMIRSRVHNPKKIYVFENESMQIYDVVKGFWGKTTKIPKIENGMRAAVVNGSIYFFGEKTLLYRKHGIWTEKSKMLMPRICSAVAVLNDVIYIIGGFSHTLDLNIVECYETKTDTWRLVPPMMNFPNFPCAVTLNGFIYVFNRISFIFPKLNLVERFDVKRNCWETVKPMKHPREFYGIAVLNGKIYCCGGIINTFQITNLVEIYDPSEDSWVDGPSMISPRAHFGLFSGGKLFAVGGRSSFDQYPIEDRILDTIEVFNPKTNVWTVESSGGPKGDFLMAAV